ncbi:MAG: hypothetical protein AB7G24_00945 [Novosphingobium sp.]
MMMITTTAPVIDRVLALVARQLRHPDQHSRLAADAALEGDLRIDAIDRLCISCAVVDRDGCERKPSWRIIANRVTYDQDNDRAVFHGARLEVFGVPLEVVRAECRRLRDMGLLILHPAYDEDDGGYKGSAWFPRHPKGLAVRRYLMEQNNEQD